MKEIAICDGIFRLYRVKILEIFILLEKDIVMGITFLFNFLLKNLFQYKKGEIFFDSLFMNLSQWKM